MKEKKLRSLLVSALLISTPAFSLVACKVGDDAAREWKEEAKNRDVDNRRSCASRFVGPSRDGDELALSDPSLQVAQGFTADSGFTARTVRLRLKSVGTPSGRLIVKVVGNQNGTPDGVVLLTAAMDTPQTVETGADVIFAFTQSRELAAGRYWLLLRHAPATVGAGTVYWMAADGDGYPSSSALVSTNDWFWSMTGLSAGTDFLFDFGC
jgi:hypothetical protein